MSLEAKVGEMTQLTLGTILQKENKTIIEPQHLDSSRALEALVDYQVGSILNCGNHAHSPEKWHEFITGIQEHAARKASGIPVLYGVDAIHGPTYTAEAVLGPANRVGRHMECIACSKTQRPQQSRLLLAAFRGIFRPYSIWAVIRAGRVFGKPSEKTRYLLHASA